MSWTKTTKVCAHCANEFHGHASRRFCGTQCQVLASSKEDASGCWIWQKAMSPDGYGRAWQSSRKATKPAMRLAYEAFKGPVPDEMCVCHTCDVRACVNPDHLWLGGQADNNRDMVAKGRQSRGIKRSQAKLTDNDVRAIRSDPRGCNRLGKHYGVNPSCIQKIRRRQTWSHVT